MRFVGLFVAASVFVSPTAALELQLPIRCVLGETCFIQNYVDRDNGPGASDVSCAGRTYDGHKGTDFALADLRTMWRGVEVVAAADGVVGGVRDSMGDIASDSARAPLLKGRECGNGAIITFGDGWSGQYCHLKKSSIRVRVGDRIKAGDVIGKVGLSGFTEFPHVHFSLKRNGEVVDPFDGSVAAKPCGPGGESLWAAESGIVYQPGGIMSAGFATKRPEYEDIKRRSPHLPSIEISSRPLFIWAHFYGVAKGDVIKVQFTGPDGEIVVKTDYQMPKRQAARFTFSGRPSPHRGWQAGEYIGTATLMRDGETIATRVVESVMR